MSGFGDYVIAKAFVLNFVIRSRSSCIVCWALNCHHLYLYLIDLVDYSMAVSDVMT